MKKFLFLSFAVFFAAAVFGQSTEIITVKGSNAHDFLATKTYKYPNFIQSSIYFKKGEKALAKVNYNYILGGMQYINEHKDTLLLDNVDDLNYIAIATDTFFYDNGYLEWMASSPNNKLARRVSLTILGAQTVGAFGSTNNTAKVEGIGTLYTTGLDVNEDMKFKKSVSYFIRGAKGDFMPASKGNFEDVFPNVDISSYVKENKLNLKKEGDVVDLFLYANSSIAKK